jgi:Glycosyl hydrolase 2 galactose-binding domain-like
MFIEYRVDVKPYLEAGSNTLVITFPSTFLKGRELQTNNGTLACWNGDPSRLHVRKAQYQYVPLHLCLSSLINIPNQLWLGLGPFARCTASSASSLSFIAL